MSPNVKVAKAVIGRKSFTLLQKQMVSLMCLGDWFMP